EAFSQAVDPIARRHRGSGAPTPSKPQMRPERAGARLQRPDRDRDGAARGNAASRPAIPRPHVTREPRLYLMMASRARCSRPMPELPEVETTRRGVRPHLLGRAIADVVVREPRLRWPLPRDLRRRLVGATVRDVERRAKYLLFRLGRGADDAGTLLVHLGMSGSLRVLAAATPA